MPSNTLQILGKCQKLAECDYFNLPGKVIQEKLGCTHSHLTELRQREEYKQCLREFDEAWKERIRKSPDYNYLAREIKMAVGISVKKLVMMISDEDTVNKDLISAARLLAQMDGTFLGKDATTGDVDPTAGDSTSVASELLQMLKRHERVQ